MGTQEKILKENNVYFIYGKFTFFCMTSKLKYHKDFHEGSYNTL